MIDLSSATFAISMFALFLSALYIVFGRYV